MKITNREALKIIVNAAKNYESRLNGKHFLILYQNGNTVCNVEVGFRDLNFLHMTGVKTKLSAQVFYSACLNGKISEKDFTIDDSGKAQRKLSVLPYLHELLYNNCMIGDFINSGVFIQSDYFVGDTKAVLSVGFRFGKKVDFPVSLYKENVKKLIKPVYKVLAVFSKNYNEEKYNICTYLSKNQCLEKLTLPSCVGDSVNFNSAEGI